ncbi:DUF2057 domain-containing protein [Vibrio sp. ZSDE26]|uniref:DUF2057 domain-containing protein n=1 Tax=Vibrio amylolyticus TaxID=2847292 RepID=A0A9X1XFU4_9VIBR|nr:DUF2057 family protein [Vibrio amylolyticus]MCK6262212.1 DUF2057 domain-containing protein [Vibrio amylolyticus]
MKVMNNVLVVGAMFTSFAPMAAVDVILDRNISALVAHGEEVGFSISKVDKLEFGNGQNQVVLRVEQLVSNRGEKEKFNSKPIVLTFDAKNTTLNVATKSPISRVEHSEAFNRDPSFLITDASGKEITIRQDILPASSGISRDYLKELDRYNSKHSINIATATVATAAVVVEAKPEASLASSKPTQMVEYWFEKASKEDKSTFSDWAFDNRKAKEVDALEGSKALEMASYWFTQSSSKERKQTLSWLLEQE